MGLVWWRKRNCEGVCARWGMVEERVDAMDHNDNDS